MNTHTELPPAWWLQTDEGAKWQARQSKGRAKRHAELLAERESLIAERDEKLSKLADARWEAEAAVKAKRAELEAAVTSYHQKLGAVQGQERVFANKLAEIDAGLLEARPQAIDGVVSELLDLQERVPLLVSPAAEERIVELGGGKVRIEVWSNRPAIERATAKLKNLIARGQTLHTIRCDVQKSLAEIRSETPDFENIVMEKIDSQTKETTQWQPVIG